jgi:hypothetical protein
MSNPAVQTGIAVVYGFPGTIAVVGLASVSFFNDSGDVSGDHTVDEVRDEDNDVRTLVHSGALLEATLTLTPRSPADVPGSGNTLSSAKLSLAKPAPGAVVTLSNFDSPLLNSTWSYVGGFRTSFRKDGVASYTFRIRRSDAGYDIVTKAGP